MHYNKFYSALQSPLKSLQSQSMKRYIPEIDFPPYRFIPGRAPHPEKEGYMKGHKIEFSGTWEPSNSTAWKNGWLYAVDLFNANYFWESHVYWEALWNMIGRKGDQANILKALIKIAAGGVKIQMSQQEIGEGHIKRAIELLSEINLNEVSLSYFDHSALLKSLNNKEITINQFPKIQLNEELTKII